MKAKYPIEYYEHKQFIGTSLWKESDPEYLTAKADPSKSFMKRIRNRLKDLNLKERQIKNNLALINPYKILNPKLN